jgi:hypothetical protein
MHPSKFVYWTIVLPYALAIRAFTISTAVIRILYTRALA